MNLLELWRNRETKAKLREKNRQLKETLNMFYGMRQPLLTIDRRRLLTLRATHLLVDDIPTDFIKEMVIEDLTDKILPFVEWDVKDNHSQKTLVGTIRIGGIYNEKES